MAAKPTLKGIHRVLVVKVTQPIIDRAEKRDSSHCMIADAIRAAFPEAKQVSVDLATIRFTDPTKKQRYIYLTPLPAQRALVDFDQGVPAAPFNFQLKKAAQVVESGRRNMPDGTSKPPSRAVQKVTSATGSKQPTKLGGEPPPRGALSSTPSQSKRGRAAAAASAPTTTAKVPPKRLTAAAKRAADLKTAKQQAAARGRGEPATKTGSNVTLAKTPGRVRAFGLKQLRA